MFPRIHPCQPRYLPFNEVSILLPCRMLFHFASLIYSPRYSQSPNCPFRPDPGSYRGALRRCFADASSIFCPNDIVVRRIFLRDIGDVKHWNTLYSQNTCFQKETGCWRILHRTVTLLSLSKWANRSLYRWKWLLRAIFVKIWVTERK